MTSCAVFSMFSQKLQTNASLANIKDSENILIFETIVHVIMVK